MAKNNFKKKTGIGSESEHDYKAKAL